VPNAIVAAFVPAPAIATPAASFSNVKEIELLTVAVTVNVPEDVSCALAHVGIDSRPATTTIALSKRLAPTAFLLFS